jgi:glutamyl endopeptidase
MTAEQANFVPEIVFPDDNRVRINPTTINPYWWVGRLHIVFPRGVSGHGSGTLVGPNKVLTCAHNLYQEAYGGWATSITFALARNGDEYPYGTRSSVRANVPELYRRYCPPPPVGPDVDYTRYVYDYGVVTIEGMLEPDGITYPAIHVAGDAPLQQAEIDIAGYPADKPAGTMWQGSGRLRSAAPEFLFYRISTYAGQSGSSLRCRLPNVYPHDMKHIVGIHVAGSDRLESNFAVRINAGVAEEINSWL